MLKANLQVDEGRRTDIISRYNVLCNMFLYIFKILWFFIKKENNIPVATLFLAYVSCYIISLLFTIEQLAISFNNLISYRYIIFTSIFKLLASTVRTYYFLYITALLTYPTMTRQSKRNPLCNSALRSQLLLAVDL